MGGSSGLPARVDRVTCTRWARRLPAPAPARSSSSSLPSSSPSPSRSPFAADGASAALVRAMRLRSGDVDNRFVRCLAHRRLLFVVYAPPLPLHLPFSSGSDAPFPLPFPPSLTLSLSYFRTAARLRHVVPASPTALCARVGRLDRLSLAPGFHPSLFHLPFPLLRFSPSSRAFPFLIGRLDACLAGWLERGWSSG